MKVLFFIGWQKLYRKIRKAAEIEGKIAFVPENKLIYDGPILKSIPPSDFVFDTSVDFEKAAKIYHTKRPLTEVLEDKNNNYLTSEIKAELAACGQKLMIMRKNWYTWILGRYKRWIWQYNWKSTCYNSWKALCD